MIKLERIDSPSGRFYKTPEGLFLPSVTTILAQIPNPGLDEWRKAVGEEKAAEIGRRAANRGTKLHQYCEDYLGGQRPKLDVFDRFAYNGIQSQLDRIEPIAVEEQSYSIKLRVAGTMDCLGYYTNPEGQRKLCIIDFKTTSGLKHDGEFDSYWLQCSAYAAMVFEHRGLLVQDLLIIMQDCNAGECRVFGAKTKDWLPKFKELRNSINLEYTPA